jgi:hypothetical protein
MRVRVKVVVNGLNVTKTPQQVLMQPVKGKAKVATVAQHVRLTTKVTRRRPRTVDFRIRPIRRSG